MPLQKAPHLIMTNDEEVVEETEEETEEVTPEEELKDDTDWKAEAIKARGIASRLRTKLTKASEKKVEAAKSDVKPASEKGLDRVDRAVLRAEKITAADEIALVENIAKETGKTVEQILELKYFQAELKDLRDTRVAKEAAPSGSKRTGQSPRNEVDYWIAKGELPKDNPELARQVVAAKRAKAQNTNQFSDTPVIS